jgi:hypothetical protein
MLQCGSVRTVSTVIYVSLLVLYACLSVRLKLHWCPYFIYKYSEFSLDAVVGKRESHYAGMRRISTFRSATDCIYDGDPMRLYRGADKSLARPWMKQATATEDFDSIYPIYNHNWRNISNISIYKTSIKRNILTIKQNISGSRSG